jgi:hypothetical protein
MCLEMKIVLWVKSFINGTLSSGSAATGTEQYLFIACLSEDGFVS